MSGDHEPGERAPIGTWRGLYLFTAGLLLVQIVLFYVVSRYFG